MKMPSGDGRATARGQRRYQPDLVGAHDGASFKPDPLDADLGARFKPDPQLVAQGWDYRFVAGGPRLKETVQLYRELGFEVMALPVSAESFADECDGCQVVGLLELRMIYTRRPNRSGKPGAAKDTDGGGQPA